MSEEVVLDRARRADVASLQATSHNLHWEQPPFFGISCASSPETLDALGHVTGTGEGAYVT